MFFSSNPPLSLYIHLPWCVRKCPYCDFNSHENKSAEDEEAYINALIRDVEFELPRIWGRMIMSVFIGGGTPSLFSEKSIDKLMSALRARLNLHPEIEVTLEANPGTAEANKFKAYREAGINRLSIGIQSFDDRFLKSLGRIHDANEAMGAVELANKAGFENINLDLMFGLPEQCIEQSQSDLNKAVALTPTHLSWYQLTIEPNTVFYSKPPILPEDDYLYDMQEQGQAYLSENGYKKYEISAYAKEKSLSFHNTNYWQFGDYLGIGAGAHGKITNVAEGKIERFTRHKIPKRYIQLAGDDAVITEVKKLSRNDLPLEFLMNAMRLTDGVDTKLYLERTGLPLKQIEKQLMMASENGLIDWQIDTLKPTETGQRFLNDLLELFVI